MKLKQKSCIHCHTWTKIRDIMTHNQSRSCDRTEKYTVNIFISVLSTINEYGVNIPIFTGAVALLASDTKFGTRSDLYFSASELMSVCSVPIETVLPFYWK